MNQDTVRRVLKYLPLAAVLLYAAGLAFTGDIDTALALAGAALSRGIDLSKILPAPPAA